MKDFFEIIIGKISNVVPTTLDIKNNIEDCSDEDALAIKEMFSLKMKHKFIERNDFLQNFVVNVNSKTFQCFGFSFIPKLETDDKYNYFGRLDSYFLAEDKLNSEILIVDRYDSFPKKKYTIAPNFKSFLELLPILLEYDKYGYIGVSYTDSKKKEVLSKIKNHLHKRKYYSFFKESII